MFTELYKQTVEDMTKMVFMDNIISRILKCYFIVCEIWLFGSNYRIVNISSFEIVLPNRIEYNDPIH